MQVPEKNLISLKLGIQEIKKSLPVFFSRMVPSHFFTVHNVGTELPLSAVKSRVLLCLSAIGSPKGFVKCIEKVFSFAISSVHSIFMLSIFQMSL